MTPGSGGRQGGQLLLAAGLLTLVNDYLPGAGHLDLLVLNTLALTAIALGTAALFVPWERLPQRAPLGLLAPALGMLVVSGIYGGVSAYSYAVYYVVVFVWVGIAQPPGTAMLVSPLAVLAYLTPFLVDDTPPETAISSVTVAVPVCVLVGETLARSVAGLRESRADLRARVELVERLAAASGRLGRDLDVPSTRARLLTCARELFDARAAALSSDDVLVAVDGVTEDVVGLPGDGGWQGVGELVTVPCDDGALHLVVPDASAVSSEDRDVLLLLAAQGTAALANARTHAAVVAQREHEQAVVDVLADGVLVLDRDGVVQSCNEVAAGLLGRPCAEVVGTRPPLEVGPPGTPLHHAVGARWIETATTVLDETGELVIALRDVSRQRALDEAKDLFLATTSHELRTPLTAIKGYVHVLQRRWDVLGDDRRRQALETVAERTDALVALTDHLLLGARAGASRHSGQSRPFELNGEVAATVRGYDGLSDRHALLLELPDELLIALGDPTSLHHIVGQLVENAVKYSPGGGAVTVSAHRDGGFAVVDVADEGVGIPAGAEESLFMPFFQAGATNTREYGGVGLGLYIVRQLVEAQGGSVRAQNRPGGGALVRFTVPLSAQPPRPRPAT